MYVEVIFLMMKMKRELTLPFKPIQEATKTAIGQVNDESNESKIMQTKNNRSFPKLIFLKACINSINYFANESIK